MKTKYDELAELAGLATPGPWSIEADGVVAGCAGDAFKPFGGCGCCGSPWMNANKKDQQQIDAEFMAAADPNSVLELIGNTKALAEALEPFVLHNSSEETITITVKTADVAKARAALKSIQGEA